MSDQTVSIIAHTVPTPLVVPSRSGLGLSSHAPAFPADLSDQQISIDSTVDLVLNVPPDEDQQTDRQDSSNRGHWKDRPAFPGLTLSVSEALSLVPAKGCRPGKRPW